MSNNKKHSFLHDLDLSATLTVLGIVLLFSVAVVIVLFAPHYVDPSWTTPTSSYMRQVYEIADPNLYISSTGTYRKDLEFVYHLKDKATLLAFQESQTTRIIAPKELEQFVTRLGEKNLKLTSSLMLLKPAKGEAADAEKLRLQNLWISTNSNWKEKGLTKPDFLIMELFAPHTEEAFALASTEGILESWVDQNFQLLDEPREPYHEQAGVIYVHNPVEYRVRYKHFGKETTWSYDPNGEEVPSLAVLTKEPMNFVSRKALIEEGEHLFAVSGCWYCHTDQTRTLVQDVVLNGSDSFPAPPSSANEYIYQKISFPGTKRNGPDLSRVGIKKPSRDWHIGHFWSPKTTSKGSIMPAFRHFFDDNPSGTSRMETGVPNRKFEAIYQYLITKGTRITAPTQAWWLGRDPVNTIDIIEGRKR